MDNDNNLMQRLITGDSIAIKILVDRYSAKIYKVAYRFLNDATEAQDMTQETFLRAWKQKEWSSKESYAVYAWFVRVVSNLSIDHLRKRKRTSYKDHVDLDVASLAQEPERQLQSHQENQKIQKAIKKLPPRQQIAIELFYFQDFSQKQVSQTLSISLYALESLLARARKNLKKALKKEKNYTVKPHSIQRKTV